jgi:hypothetical protein
MALPGCYISCGIAKPLSLIAIFAKISLAMTEWEETWLCQCLHCVDDMVADGVFFSFFFWNDRLSRGTKFQTEVSGAISSSGLLVVAAKQ